MRTGRGRTWWTALAVAGALGAGLLPAVGADATSREYTPRRPPATSSTCAGIRGNGQNLFAHYGALARHVEEYGVITCAAGGSSGSITTFLLESIWANPDLHNCGSRNGRLRRCRTSDREARMALMLKSVVGLTDTGLFQDVATVGALIDEVTAGGIVELLEIDPRGHRRARTGAA